MRPRLALAATLALVGVVGCGLMPSNGALTAANHIQTSVQGSRTTWTVTPWPLDRTTALLCVKKPGPEFTAADPRSADVTGCAPLAVMPRGDAVDVTFDAATLDPAVAARFATSTAPWYLVVAGSRGGASSTIVTEIAVSPLPSDAGPS